MIAGTGLARSPSAVDGAVDASLQALERSGHDHADVALVFTTGDAYPAAPALLHAVRRVTGARAVVGCSGTGVLTERGEVEGQAAVATLVLAGEELVATPFLVADQETSGTAVGAEVARQVGRTVAEGGCVIVLPDVAGLDPPVLLEGLQQELGFLPVLGAVAAGAPLFELHNTEAARGALTGLALSGPAPVIGVAQGCAPIGEPYVITRADGHVMFEIGSRPALEVLREAIEAVPGGKSRLARAGVFAGLAIDPAKSPLERGDFLVRNLVGADPERGAVAVAEPVRVGQTIQFQVRDAESSRDDLQSTLEDVARRLDGRQPVFGCYLNCCGRGRALYGMPDHDVRLIRARLGTFPLIGFFGNGEFAPVGRRNFFHNYTGALVVFAG